MGKANNSLFAASVSHEQDGCHVIYGKTLQTSFSPEPVDRFSRNFVCSIGDSSTS